jgi:hypothetical protein
MMIATLCCTLIPAPGRELQEPVTDNLARRA